MGNGQERRSGGDRRVGPRRVENGDLAVGDLVIAYDRVWRIGLLNECRARLDPITGGVIKGDPSSGRFWQTIGDSISISPTSCLDSAEDYEFTPREMERLIRLLEVAEQSEANTAEMKRLNQETARLKREIEELADEALDDAEIDRRLAEAERELAKLSSQQQQRERTQMAAAAAAAPAGVAETPAAETKAQKLKRLNEERLAKLKENKAKAAETKTAEKAAKPAREKKVREKKECQCGCGGETFGFFVPGHDAKFKGNLLSIERGDAKREELLEPDVIAKYKWVKSGLKGKAGEGFRPTTNYKGEAHEGYVKTPAE